VKVAVTSGLKGGKLSSLVVVLLDAEDIEGGLVGKGRYPP
jgi:hypothetical protein